MVKPDKLGKDVQLFQNKTIDYSAAEVRMVLLKRLKSPDLAKYQIGPGNWYFAKRNISQSTKLALGIGTLRKKSTNWSWELVLCETIYFAAAATKYFVSFRKVP